MRPIKFRAWHKKLKVMLPDVGVNKGEVLYDGRWYRKDEIVLMQYTGLKDRNGREIYEGDIVKLTNWIGSIGVVEWGRFAKFIIDAECSNGGIFDFTNLIFEEVSNSIKNLEVIGNIYKNPEMLGGRCRAYKKKR